MRKLSLLDTVLQTGPPHPMGGMWFGGSIILAAISAVSTLLISIGVFYVLVKVGSFLDSMKP